MTHRADVARTLLAFSDGVELLAASQPTPVLPEISDSTPLELRQISGITAGSVFPIEPGGLRLGLGPDRVEFELRLRPPGQVIVLPRSLPILLDGQPVVGPTIVGDATLEIDGARFVVSRRRSTTQRRRAGVRIEHTPNEPVIPVPAVDGDAFTAELVKRVSAARRVVVSQRRRSQPNAVELLHAARYDDGLRWSRPTAHGSFFQVAVAHADVAWRPRFDRPGRIDTPSARALEPLQRLVAVPVTADLRSGPLAIIGARPARLAVARHVVLSLTTMTAPSELELAVLAPSGSADDWSWADRLPHTRSGPDHAVPVLVVDGPEQLQGQLGAALTEPGGIGTVILGDDVNDITMPCSMTIFVADDWTATIVDHVSGATHRRATPLGFTEAIAERAAFDLQDATLETVQAARH